MKKNQPTSKDKDLASKLKAIYESKKRAERVTQKEAAKELGMSQSAVSQYLNGDIPLNLEAGLKFCAFLEIEPAKLNSEWGKLIEPFMYMQAGKPVTLLVEDPRAPYSTREAECPETQMIIEGMKGLPQSARLRILAATMKEREDIEAARRKGK